MRADFSPERVHLDLTPREYSFLINSVVDRLGSLPADDVQARLGLPSEEANGLVDEILKVETDARRAGHHWLPPRPPV